MVVFGQSGCFRAKLLYSSKSGCVRGKNVVFGKSGCIRVKLLYSAKSGCYQSK